MTADPTRPFAGMAGGTAVVTGAARGIGLTIAQRLQALGLHLLVIDKDGDELGRAVPELQQTGSATGVATTLSTDECLEPITAALESLPPLTVWVNNAGRVSHQDAEEVDLDLFEEVMRDNTVSALRGSQIAFRAFTAPGRDGGAIVNITSLVTEKALPKRLSYSTSKAALGNVTRHCAQEWGKHGIRVNAVSPGYFLSDMTRQFIDANPDVGEGWRQRVPAGRLGEPPDLRGLVVFLASDASRYVVGESVVIDGGYTLV
jgi:NAD(P)-dependent dehydrogenase (short-subunit alcohol dehydrogenase family)